MELVWEGLVAALSPQSILVILVGVFVGIIIGIIPGIGAGVGLALLLPVIFNFPPLLGLMLLIALWAADGYGASITSILMKVPGGAGAVATCFDGYPMARQGKASEAIGLSMGASMVGGILGAVVLMLVAPPLAKLAVEIGPAEYTVLAILGMTLIGGMSVEEPIKGLIAAVIGLMTSFIGYDLSTGFVRYNFGTQYLFDGVELTLALIGIFAIASLVEAGQQGGTVVEMGEMSGSVVKGLKDALFRWPISTLRGSLAGIFMGVVPGIGITLSSLVAYDLEKRFSKHPEKFGQGAAEGVIGPEAANNSTQPASLIPTLTLGIPAGSTSAIFLGALIMYGINPGMSLFQERGVMVWALMWGIIVASVAYVAVGLLFANFFARLTIVPIEYLVPITLTTCFIGAYTENNSYGDLVVALVFGALGLLMAVLKYPAAPAILGVVLGPILERNYSRALLMSQGSHQIFFETPLLIGMWILLALVIGGPVFLKIMRRRAKV
jgi:putative tricarboxylic transport membrane protein